MSKPLPCVSSLIGTTLQNAPMTERDSRVVGLASLPTSLYTWGHSTIASGPFSTARPMAATGARGSTAPGDSLGLTWSRRKTHCCHRASGCDDRQPPRRQRFVVTSGCVALSPSPAVAFFFIDAPCVVELNDIVIGDDTARERGRRFASRWIWLTPRTSALSSVNMYVTKGRHK
jgi:hypothetical protein